MAEMSPNLWKNINLHIQYKWGGWEKNYWTKEMTLDNNSDTQKQMKRTRNDK